MLAFFTSSLPITTWNKAIVDTKRPLITAMAFERNLLIVTILITLGTLASEATSGTLYQASIAEKHEQWMKKHGRVYQDSAEKERRFHIFKNNVEVVEKFNSEGNMTYSLGINQFSDMTYDEFLRHYTGYKQPTESTSSADASFTYENLSPADVLTSIDWREKGAVTPVKFQGRCGKSTNRHINIGISFVRMYVLH